jgi:hypothetical protein
MMRRAWRSALNDLPTVACRILCKDRNSGLVSHQNHYFYQIDISKTSLLLAPATPPLVDTNRFDE